MLFTWFRAFHEAKSQSIPIAYRLTLTDDNGIENEKYAYVTEKKQRTHITPKYACVLHCTVTASVLASVSTVE